MHLYKLAVLDETVLYNLALNLTISKHESKDKVAFKVDPNTMKELMRHSSIDMQEHYKHTTAQEVLYKINELALWR